MSNIIYFDSAARTIPYPEVLEEFNKMNSLFFANPSSIHFEGVKANRKIDKCRSEILNSLKLKNHNVIYVNNASEANNLAIKGFALKYKNRGNHIITTQYEHPSVIECFKQLEENFGFKVTYLKPNSEGKITVQNVIDNITNETILVSVMAVNNEIGSINPIAEIAKELKKYPKLAFHCDACQAVGKIDIDYSEVAMISLSSHKIHGLVSGGALIVRKNLELLPLVSGGGQEYGFRSGTTDVAAISSFTLALTKSIKELNSHFNKVKELHKTLVDYLLSRPEDYEINSDLNNPYIVNFSTKQKKGSVVVEALSSKGIMVSSTSACSSYKEKGSYVVKSLAKSDSVANNTIRISFSYLNNLDEVNTLINELTNIIGAIR